MNESPTNSTGDVGGGSPSGVISRRDIQQITINATRGRPLTPQEREKSINLLLAIIDDPKAARRTKITATRALAALEALDLRDIHHTEKMQHESGILDLRMRRAEEGKPNDCIAVQMAPVERLPEPDWLMKRRKLLEPGTS